MAHVLVPVAILEGETVPPGLIDLLGTVDVTILGYHEVPEQTPPDQARAQFEDRGVSALEDIEQEFREAGGDADHRLVFTHDAEQTIERVAAEIEADATVISGPTGDVDRILVPLGGEVDADRIVSFLATLIGDRDISVTVLTPADADGDSGAEGLQSALDDLAAAGIDVTIEAAPGRLLPEIEDAAPGHDVIVLGEAAPSLASLVFGDRAEWVASATVGPVIVVRRPPPPE